MENLKPEDFKTVVAKIAEVELKTLEVVLRTEEEVVSKTVGLEHSKMGHCSADSEDQVQKYHYFDS